MNVSGFEKKFQIGTAIAIGLICALPHILIPLLKPADVPYLPIYKKAITGANEDEVTLAPLMNRSLRDVVIPREGFLYEHRHAPTPREWLPHAAAGLLRIAAGSLENVFIICDFVLPPLLYLALSSFLFLLTGNLLWSIFISVFVLFASDLMEFIPLHGQSWTDLTLWLTSYSSPPPFLITRFPTPELTGIFLWTAFFLLFKLLESPNIKKSLLLGANWGLLFYCYTYYWEAFTGGCLLTAGYFLLKREIPIFKFLMIGFAAALLVSIPFWMEFIKAMQLPHAQDFWIKYGMRTGRFFFKFLSLKFLLITAAGLLLARKDKKAWVLACFMLSGLVCYNQQVILGRAVEPEHWPTRILNPWAWLFLGYCVHSRLGSRFKPLIAGLALGVLAWAGCIQTSYALDARLSYPLFKEFEPQVKALKWMKQNTLDTDVVLSLDPEVIALIPVYSYNYAFIHTGTSNSSFSEVVERIFGAYKLLGVPESFLEKQLTRSHLDPARWNYYDKWIAPLGKNTAPVLKKIYEKESWLIAFFLHRYYYDAQMLSSRPEVRHPDEIRKLIEKGSYRYVPPDELAALMNRFRQTSENPSGLLSKYKLDYVYVGPYDRAIPVTIPEDYQKVYDDPAGQISIYRVPKKSLAQAA